MGNPIQFDTFLSEVCEFRKAMGDLTNFFTRINNIPRIHLSLKGLAFVYLNTVTNSEEQEQSLRRAFWSTVYEFNHREWHLSLVPHPTYGLFTESFYFEDLDFGIRGKTEMTS